MIDALVRYGGALASILTRYDVLPHMTVLR